MFKNREFAIKMRKTKDEPKNDATPKMINLHIDDIVTGVKRVVIIGAVAVYGYVLVDTFRSVQTERAKHSDQDED